MGVVLSALEALASGLVRLPAPPSLAKYFLIELELDN